VNTFDASVDGPDQTRPTDAQDRGIVPYPELDRTPARRQEDPLKEPNRFVLIEVRH
jgi:hypothetical protein